MRWRHHKTDPFDACVRRGRETASGGVSDSPRLRKCSMNSAKLRPELVVGGWYTKNAYSSKWTAHPPSPAKMVSDGWPSQTRRST